MRRRTSSNTSRRTITILILISVTVLTIDARSSGPIRAIRSVALDIFSPVRSASDKVFSPFRSAWHGAFKYDDVKRDNDKLKAEVERLKGDAANGKVAIGKLDALQKATSLPFLSQYKRIAAEVVYGPSSNYDDTFQIAKGTNDGVTLGDPVVTGAGMVGRVIQVASGHCVVRRLTDQRTGIGARAVPAFNGVLEGAGAGQPLRFTGITLGTKIVVGVTVETSGATGSDLPAGIPIGVVSKVKNKSGSGYLEIEVTPFASLDELVYVTVIATKSKAP